MYACDWVSSRGELFTKGFHKGSGRPNVFDGKRGLPYKLVCGMRRRRWWLRPTAVQIPGKRADTRYFWEQRPKLLVWPQGQILSGLVSDYAVASDKQSLVDRLWLVSWIGNPRKGRLTHLCHARHVTGAKPLACRAPSRAPAVGVTRGWSGLRRSAEQSRSAEPTPPPRYANRPSTNRHRPPARYRASLPHPPRHR